MCRFLSVSRSTYYSWLKRRGMEDKDGPLIEAIRTGQNINKNTYGYRRMTLWLNNFIGIHVNNKRVRRVMKKAGLQAEIRKKKKFKNNHKEEKDNENKTGSSRIWFDI